MKIILALLSKVSLSTIVTCIVSLFSYLAKNKKHKQIDAEEKANEYEQIIDDIEASRKINEAVNDMPSSDVDNKLRAKGWFRKE